MVHVCCCFEKSLLFKNVGDSSEQFKFIASLPGPLELGCFLVIPLEVDGSVIECGHLDISK